MSGEDVGGSLEELLTALNKSGWLLTSLSQWDPSQWSVSLRRTGEMSSVYGSGASAREALKDAMDNRKGYMSERAWAKLKEAGNPASKPLVRKRLAKRRRRSRGRA